MAAKDWRGRAEKYVAARVGEAKPEKAPEKIRRHKHQPCMLASRFIIHDACVCDVLLVALPPLKLSVGSLSPSATCDIVRGSSMHSVNCRLTFLLDLPCSLTSPCVLDVFGAGNASHLVLQSLARPGPASKMFSQ